LRAPLALALLLAALAGGGCDTLPKPPEHFVQFYLESTPGKGVALTMPVSHLQYYRAAEPFMTAADVSKVDEASVQIVGTNNKVLGLMFTFDPLRQHDLMMFTGSNLGRKIFVYDNDNPIGVHPIEQIVQDGQLFVFVEVKDQAELEKMVADLQASQVNIVKMKNSK
jgi:hypothetical protein